MVGVRTDRDGAELRAKVVIACDGVNSFLAKEAGLLPRAEASHHTLGVKEVLDLPPSVINERFGVQGHEGVDIEMLGCTRGIPGGGFLYTNADSVSVGVVLSLPAAGRVRGAARGAGRRPQGPPVHRPLPAGLRAARVRRPPHPRGRATTPCPRWPPTGCWSPATPRP